MLTVTVVKKVDVDVATCDTMAVDPTVVVLAVKVTVVLEVTGSGVTVKVVVLAFYQQMELILTTGGTNTRLEVVAVILAKVDALPVLARLLALLSLLILVAAPVGLRSLALLELDDPRLPLAEEIRSTKEVAKGYANVETVPSVVTS